MKPITKEGNIIFCRKDYIRTFTYSAKINPIMLKFVAGESYFVYYCGVGARFKNKKCKTIHTVYVCQKKLKYLGTFYYSNYSKKKLLKMKMFKTDDNFRSFFEDMPSFHEYFYILKDLRKLKLKKINGKI